MRNPLPPEVLSSRVSPRDLDLRGDYFRDVTAIIHSTPFRRLKHKTQAFYAPQHDHICTRMEHVLHVATVAATICKALGLDADLAQAIALAHDLGHGPFGHEGERVLNAKTAEIGGFIHELHGLRVVDVLAHNGRGLNLTYGVRDGIISHCGERFEQRLWPEPLQKNLPLVRDRGLAPNTYEGCVVRLADKIAYLGRDLEDAVTAKFVVLSELDPVVRHALGSSNGQIIGTLVDDVVGASRNQSYIGFSDDKNELVGKLYAFNKRRIYQHPRMERYRLFCQRIVEGVFDYLYVLFQRYGWDFAAYAAGSLRLEVRFGEFLSGMHQVYVSASVPAIRIVADYVAGMTDDFAIDSIRQITIPAPIEFD